MLIKQSPLEGVFEIENYIFNDERGSFVKVFHSDVFKAAGLETEFKESFYSVSKKNVIRGMHYQLSPYDHAKLVYVVCGEILDVAVDVRDGSESYGQYFSTKLSAENGKALYIESGFAHGFLTLSESATVLYMTTSIHAPSADVGIRWDGFGFDWGGGEYIVSERDQMFKVITGT